MQALTNLNNMFLPSYNKMRRRSGSPQQGSFIAIYCVGIMLNNDNSPAARTERWAQLKKVFLCAAIIAGTGAFVQLATGLGGMV